MKVINVDVDTSMTFDSILDNYTNVSESISKVEIPTGNYNTYLLNFNFTTPNPEGLVIVAVFKKENVNQEIRCIAKQIDSYDFACYVPWELLCKTGTVTLGLYGFSLDSIGNLEERFSLEPIEFDVVTGSYSKISEAKYSPTPDILEQYIEEAINNLGIEILTDSEINEILNS